MEGTTPDLPIEALRPSFEAMVAPSSVVVTSPTGSGKSTQIPRWCRAHGKVLVMEPRRVACRALAQFVAQLEGEELGRAVGYHVRDDPRMGRHTEILFATPGIVLRMMASGAWKEYATFVIDEFHERSLDVDLALAIAKASFGGRLVVMSATLDGDKVATYLGGTHLRAEGRQFAVSVDYGGGHNLLPDPQGLAERCQRAIDGLEGVGDILVFLPGKGEIRSVQERLRGPGRSVLPLHGGLSLKEQSRVFARSDQPKVILATNVAETSLTVEGIGAVVDSGLERRTRYHAGRGYLTLSAIAQDSAEQRTGRAGRLGPGRCVRLWSAKARLAARTPPEIERESLLPLVLASAAIGHRVQSLSFVDAPSVHALEVACELGAALGALDADGGITARGRRLFQLPLDPALGRMLIEAKGTEAMDDMVELVSALGIGMPLFEGDQQEEGDLRREGCDATALIRALREGHPQTPGVHPGALAAARDLNRRLRSLFELPKTATGRPKAQRLAELVLRALPFSAHVKRQHGRRTAWSNGGTEIGLERRSAIDEEKREAILVLATRAVGVDLRKRELRATYAMPVSFRWLTTMGLGEERLGDIRKKQGQIVVTAERHYAARVIATHDIVPTGPLARDAIVVLYARGSLFGKQHELARSRLARWELYGRLRSAGMMPDSGEGLAAVTLEDWLGCHLEELGVEGIDDLDLLNPSDLLPPTLPEPARTTLDREFPTTFTVANTHYRLEYDLAKREVVFHQVQGQRKEAPPIAFLPRLSGFRILWRSKSKTQVLRER